MRLADEEFADQAADASAGEDRGRLEEDVEVRGRLLAGSERAGSERTGARCRVKISS